MANWKDDPLPSQRRQKFTSGSYRGAYSQVNMGSPSKFNPFGYSVATDSTPDPFGAVASPREAFESSGVVGSADVPDVGGVDDGRGSPKR